jgi:hypothetical protein
VALRALSRQEGLRTLVPGYGEPGPAPVLIAAADAYLAALDEGVQALLDGGADLLEAQRRVELPAWRHWARYEAFHRRNVQRQYLAAELRWLGGAEPSPPR